MTGRSGYVALAVSFVIACVCAGLVAWRLTASHPKGPAPPAATAPENPAQVGLAPQASKISTIIDLPGDPVLVRRGEVTAPKDLLIAVPARLGQDVPKLVAKAYFVNSPLVSTTGGYMGKFPEAGQEADALAIQLAVNSAQMQAPKHRPRSTLAPTMMAAQTRRPTPRTWF